VATRPSVVWRLGKLLALPAGDRWRLVLAVFGLPLNALGVRAVGLRRWMLVLARAWRPRAGESGEAELKRAWATAQLLAMAVRRAPYRGNCLSRSLTLWWLLLGQGIRTELRIGVNRPAGQFEAHAWIEYQDVVLNDRQDVAQRFTMFERPINSDARFV
jgi:hypothetical protein